MFAQNDHSKETISRLAHENNRLKEEQARLIKRNAEFRDELEALDLKLAKFNLLTTLSQSGLLRTVKPSDELQSAIESVILSQLYSLAPEDVSNRSV